MNESNKLPGTGIVSLEKVRTKFDIRAAIFRELEKIEKGTLVSERELCSRAAGTDRSRFRRAIENNDDEFRPHRLKLRLDEREAQWYWGAREDVEAASKMRDS